MDWQSNFAMIENIKLEEKLTLMIYVVLPSKPTDTSEIRIDDIKQETLEDEGQQSAFESNHDVCKKFELKMYEELDIENSENSSMNFDSISSLKNRHFVEKIENIEQDDSLERHHEIKPFSCKFCYKSFDQVHEVKEHIKIHNSLLKVENFKNQLKP